MALFHSFSWLSNIPLYICVYIYIYTHTHLIFHSPVDRHLGCFHVLATVNSAALNIGVHCIWSLLGVRQQSPGTRTASVPSSSLLPGDSFHCCFKLWGGLAQICLNRCGGNTQQRGEKAARSVTPGQRAGGRQRLGTGVPWGAGREVHGCLRVGGQPGCCRSMVVVQLSLLWQNHPPRWTGGVIVAWIQYSHGSFWENQRLKTQKQFLAQVQFASWWLLS